MDQFQSQFPDLSGEVSSEAVSTPAPLYHSPILLDILERLPGPGHLGAPVFSHPSVAPPRAPQLTLFPFGGSS